MARQDPNPPPWDATMSDGCTGVLDRLPIVGDMTDCCREHDRAYHYGGDRLAKERADKRFRNCIRWKGCLLCRLVAWIRWRAVKRLGDDAFNWRGPGLPEG